MLPRRKDKGGGRDCFPLEPFRTCLARVPPLSPVAVSDEQPPELLGRRLPEDGSVTWRTRRSRRSRWCEIRCPRSAPQLGRRKWCHRWWYPPSAPESRCGSSPSLHRQPLPRRPAPSFLTGRTRCRARIRWLAQRRWPRPSRSRRVLASLAVQPVPAVRRALLVRLLPAAPLVPVAQVAPAAQLAAAAQSL